MTHHSLSLTYRLLHLAGMALMLGGAVHVAMDIRRGAREDLRIGRLLRSATRYELIFWPILALQVLTGVGQLGLLGDALPGTETAWGGSLGIKLYLVIALVLASLPRTMILARLVAQPEADLSRQGARGMSGLYWATAAGLASVVLAATSLAHG